MWEDFFWSIYYPISIIFVVVLLIVLIIYIDPWVIALMAADGLVVFLIHLTIGLDKLREWIPILRDPHRFQRFLVGVLHTLLWILMALSILLHVLELMHFILSAMLVMLESPSIKEITDSQMRLVCSSHLLSSFKLHLFVSGCLHFRPHRKLLLAPPANAAPGAVGWAASTNEQAVVQAEKGAFPVGMGGHEDAILFSIIVPALIESTIGIGNLAQSWPTWLKFDLFSFRDNMLFSSLCTSMALPLLVIGQRLAMLISYITRFEAIAPGANTNPLDLGLCLGWLFPVSLTLLGLWVRALLAQGRDTAPTIQDDCYKQALEEFDGQELDPF
ncbi:hypothetical protein B0A48_10083 [Cryoendolithus antarcticus]|uniref:Uncharacterized protein n=1 Tax=Cryoendolithus antarcticus TaxID=1507870 RepID=A0A1V8SWI3_9PEZI|nr:hypothetical protein B0A48_10083 [Cryoendolithus antarcticus]